MRETPRTRNSTTSFFTMSLLNSLLPTLNRTPANAATEQRSHDLGATVKPAYEINGTPDAFGVTVYLPGVTKDGLELTAEEGHLHIAGRRAWKQPEGWTPLYRESADAAFELVLDHDNAIDVEKVAAEL